MDFNKLFSSDDVKGSDLEAAVRELRDLVDAEMRARHDRAGPVNRDVILSRVLAANPDLHARIESLAAADALHKVLPSAEGAPSAIRRAIEEKIAKRARTRIERLPSLSLAEAEAAEWRADPQLFALYHQPAATRPGLDGLQELAHKAHRRSCDRAVSELSESLAPGDPRLGLTLLAKRFPRLHARWSGQPVTI